MLPLTFGVSHQDDILVTLLLMLTMMMIRMCFGHWLTDLQWLEASVIQAYTRGSCDSCLLEDI